ncbi:hypothetical protein NP590_03840 [Methylomonas sp. SURF-2]|uniref:Uncharacterized protein n=1 Tax=Methylomonas subterranea TaxID=2952225 RepID=A0ABT1TCN6_9GAMM|nr:hypothetical protein [Methylomonas sp. SURF-2]MCQ8103228.1 hypothetical protein [Methylomonas sp. SURF-2]
MIEYVKKPDIANIVSRLRKQAGAELTERQEGSITGHNMRWAYVGRHLHGSEELLRVVHININLKQ